MQQPAPEPPPGPNRVLHYEILAEIPGGSMGVVYRAYDTKLKRTVALKFLPQHLSSSGAERERLLREATATSALDHPNVGIVHAVEETPDARLFIVMAFYEGETIKQILLGRGFLPLEAAGIAAQIARGLDAAHRADIVHQDLKPSNVILTVQGAAKIIDFGIATVKGTSNLTEPGTTLGTAAYMSPEQAMGRPADSRSDLWSLGVLLYEMLSGRLPFTGENNKAVLQAVVNRPPPPLTGIAAPLQAVVARALAKNPGERYQTAGELLRDLDAIAARREDPTTVQTVSAAVEKPRRTFPRWVKVAACLVLAAAVSAVAWRYREFWSGVSRPKNYAAVLQFRTSSNDPAQQALAIGLSDAIADSLARFEAVNRDFLVVPMRDMQDRKVTEIAAARKAFSIEKALTGEMTHENGRVRLSMTLVDAARQNPVSSVNIEEPEDRLPALHTRAISEAAKMLGLRAPPEPVTKARPQAYASWLRGIGFLERYYRQGNLEAAIGEFEAALRASADPLVLVGLSQAYRLRYEVSKDAQWLEPARSAVSKAIELDKTLAAAYISRGAIRNNEGNYKGAVEDFERALMLDARIDEAYRGLGRAFDGMGLKERAESTYRKAIAARPGYWAGYNRLGAYFYRQERYREAAEEFRRVVRLTPDNAQGYSNLGGALSALNELTEARRMLETAVRIEPSLPAYNNLGNLLVRQRSYPEAARAYEKALELNKSDYRIWANLGGAYYRSPGQHEKAKAAYRQAAVLAEKARAASPNEAILLSDLANYYAFLGKVAEPLELLRTALALGPGDAKVLVNAAETYEVLGFREDALAWLGKALQLGFPLKDIEQAPWFEELRKDGRFKPPGAKRKVTGSGE